MYETDDEGKTTEAAVTRCIEWAMGSPYDYSKYRLPVDSVELTELEDRVILRTPDGATFEITVKRI